MRPLFLLLFIPNFIMGQTQIGVDIDGLFQDDFSGHSVSMSANGDRVAIGTPFGGDGIFELYRGFVQIYQERDGEWTQVGPIIRGEDRGDYSGSSVSLSADGRRVAIGAPENGDFDTSMNRGHARIYEEQAGTWVQIGADIDGEREGDQSGWAVSLSANGKRVAISAVYNSDYRAGAGHVRIYEESGDIWTQLGGDIDGEGSLNFSGVSLSLSADGDRVAIGAVENRDAGVRAGHVRVFALKDSSWLQVGNDLDGDGSESLFGGSVSLTANGTRLAVGATGIAGSTMDLGQVSVYGEEGGNWNKIGLTITGEAAEDVFGSAVSLSENGRHLVVGAAGSNRDAGHVRVYAEENGDWIKTGADIIGEGRGDRSGESVALSADGKRVAIGASYNDGNGDNAGHVRVYDLNTVVSVTSARVLSNLLVYPNPNSGSLLKLTLPVGLSVLSVDLLSTQGRPLRTFPGSPESLDVTNLPAGTYLVRINTAQGSIQDWVVIQ
ncbi:T9SS type A sorting domain-containing protein [Neolewinella antarctica]|uniref:Secretion system C-terminal sorting domain-containing protein n=1 Tax=Neolewinella antarctica TaxID=442734 RepID=A0ABX0X6P9_9BACT|nr:T9SS type A sorting domain-containing protein [Neolewinella antarctica]NJC24909.1 hypothetical protein [Neolewinella antarctica]